MTRTTIKALALTTIAATALTLSGCSPANSSDGDTVTLWIRDYQRELVEPLAEAYNANNETQVEITLVPTPTFVQKLATAVAGGNPPDMASLDLVFTPYFSQAGAMVDITDRVEALPYADDLSPAHVAQAQFDDRVYGVPFTGDASVLFYNKTLFAEAGLDPEDPPSTHAEILEAATAIRVLGGSNYGFAFSGACGGCNIFSFTPLIWASDGRVLSDDGRDAELDSPEVTDALELYRDLWEADTMPSLVRTDNGPNAATAFLEGVVGMRGDGTSFLGTLAAEDQIDFGVAPLPGKDGGSASFAGGDNLSIMAGSENPDGAWDFLQWATDVEAQTILADQSVLPIRLDLLDSIYIPGDPRRQVFADALAVGQVPYSPVENEIFNDNNGVWATMISRAVFDGDIDAAQREAQVSAQSILDEVVYDDEELNR
ncbi:ABC transporter substrate-binding protein [Marisediminicola sp. LYQ85]|uniref:ABC transporter substrate-binding protein n=1 Tax=Marisediminicola sp. LYQ85 TaxID=3391062 RepID=UPI003982D82F